MRKWRPLQKATFPARKESRKLQPEKKKTSQRLSIKDEASLKKLLKLRRGPSLKNLSGLQGIKRFQKLTLAENSQLIEAIAEQYAEVFKAGFSPSSVGLETYYKAKDTETFCFTSLKGFQKLPKQKEHLYGKDSITKRMKDFYETIAMDDYRARVFFVQKFKENLGPELKYLFNSAIRGVNRH